ncbi:MAG: acyl-CoA dehydrogenase family protein [SAR202 cluster bacterium]|jgi:alkylation response protein AidB-like acyl-CoA dehydrogenase|nr:acyl-CoA dehydrogenase family protein [SAR202 cluster bacterium]MDP6299918.1 acyl-CoA dehydrogenase family protein [SAR202 cluster bacterium]MDP7102184.1 acyl-CoA dehydrogenase family protein [SAR202 cluster bacterium]MDP7224025.1 acyl-CoA dehydrogenase family protein [SAR202 cluster bacterium]MDP7412406.1 acyl-CoA dehydrogenase family protein [SAR202 cluster bacterium]|tara:strand:- start:5255 stop:6433 length:1179 start_codon:yes stop_codon:yes gene_type:complete
MQFDLPEETLMIRDTVRQFVAKELLPLEAEFDFEESNLPDDRRADLRKKVDDIGLGGMFIPEEYGGAPDIGHVARTVVQEETSATLVGHGAFGRPITEGLYQCNDEQKEKYLLPTLRSEKRMAFGITEPISGSDPSMMETNAEKRGETYIINGRKTFISTAEGCDFMMLFARIKGTEGRSGITAFLVDSDLPGFTVERQIPVIGMPSGSVTSSPSEVSFDNIEVPASNVLGEEGYGWRVLQGSLGGIRLGFGARCLALATRCLRMARDYSVRRVTFGRPIADRQAVQIMLADSAIAIENLRWMTYHAAWKMEQGRDIRPEISMIKVYGSETLQMVSDNAIQIHGGLGLSRDLPLERIYRSARTDRIVDGPNEVHRWVIARNMTRGYWFPGGN